MLSPVARFPTQATTNCALAALAGQHSLQRQRLHCRAVSRGNFAKKKMRLIYEFQKSLKNQHPSFFEIGNTRPIAGSTRVFSRGPVPTQAACSRLGRARDLPADPHPTRRQLGCKENGFEVVFQASCWPIFVCLFSHFLVTFEQILI